MGGISPSDHVPTLLGMEGSDPDGRILRLTSKGLERDGRPWLPVMGECHYSRLSCDEWDDALSKMRAGGVSIVASYVIWIHHEEEEGVFDWSGHRDLAAFVRLCRDHGLAVVLRIGPFVHGEVRNGGLPDWLYGKPFTARSQAPGYLKAVAQWFGAIGKAVSGLMFRDGGPVIGIQIENEFEASSAPWETTFMPATTYTPKGSGGDIHMLRLKQMARDAGLHAPLYTCTGWGGSPVPADAFLPVFGGYAFYAWMDDPDAQEPTQNYLFRDMRSRGHRAFDTQRMPYACCELGGGMQPFYRNRPDVPPESVEAMHIVHLGSGGNLMGYYMYHGGRNPVGKRSFLHEHRCPRIAYDYQAPIRDFGQLSASYHCLKRQCLFLQEWGGLLAGMETCLPSGAKDLAPRDGSTLRFAWRQGDGQAFVFFNHYQDHVEMPVLYDAAMTIRTDVGDVILPEGPGLTIQPGQCGILPVHFRADSLILRYATCQPLARIETADGIHYFFYAFPGMRAEYRWEHEDAPRVVEPGFGSTYHMPGPDGATLSITTLTDAQSRSCFRLFAWGADRILLTGATLLPRPDGSLSVLLDKDQPLDLHLFPPVETNLQVDGRDVDPDMEGCFQRWSWKIRAPEPKLRIDRINDATVAVHLPDDALHSFEDIRLLVDVRGDVAEAWLGGRLVHDHFCRGIRWEIGLRPFRKELQAHPLLLRVLPRPPDQPGTAYSEMAAIVSSDDATGEAVIGDIRWTSVMRLDLQGGT